MTLGEYKSIDPTFNESMFLTKVNNILFKLFTAIMTDKLDEVDHFGGDDVFAYAKAKLDNAKNQGCRQMYDELNVRFTRIVNIQKIDNKAVFTVELTSRYMDYIIDMNTGDVVSGNDSYRIEKVNTLIFEKRLDAKEIDIVRMCPGCGNSMSVNTSGVCDYCGAVFNQEDYDYVLTSIKVR